MEKKYNDELKHRNMIKTVARLVTVFGLAFLVFNFIVNPLFNFKIKRYFIESPRLEKEFDGYKIVQISDLYLSKDTSLDKLTEEIIDLKPDLITFTGNIFFEEADDYFKNFIEMKKELDESLDGKFIAYISKGETDQKLSENYQRNLYRILEENGIYLLDNRSSLINKGGKSIFVYGLTSPLDDYKLSNDQTNFKPQIINREARFALALSHNPSYGLDSDLLKMDLTLSGSRNGGWVRLPFVKGMDYGTESVFKEGLYRLDIDSGLIVSRGAGNKKGKVRILNPREIVLIELKREP